MLLSFLFVILSIVAGLALLRLLPVKLSIADYLAAAIPLGFLLSTWIMLIAVWSTNYNTGFGMWLVVVCLTVISSFMYRPQPLLPDFIKTRYTRATALWVITMIIIVSVLAQLFYTRMLMPRDDHYWSGGGSWGDLGLHTALITRFASQTKFTWDLPVYFDAPLTYPFFMDFISSILYRWGWNIQVSLIFPGIVLSLSFLQLLFGLVVRIFRSNLAAILTLFIFLSNGSLAGIYYSWKDWQRSAQPILSFITNPLKDYSNLPEYNLVFHNFVTTHLLPQRSIDIGLAVFLLIMLLIWYAWHAKRSRQARILLFSSAIVAGLLPIVHFHTYLVIVGVLGWMALVQTKRKKKIYNDWVIAELLLFAFALPLLVWQFSGSYSSSSLRFYLGWMRQPDENVLLFWARNFGIVPLLLIGNFWFLIKKRKTREFIFHLFLPLSILFILTNIMLFEPLNYNNLKLIFYSYLGTAIVVAYIISTWLRSKVLAPFGILALFLLTSVGILSIIHEARTTWIFNSSEEILIAEQFKAIVPVDARILTSDQHNHFVPTLTGRRIVMGYRGYLWVFGIDYSQTVNDISAMFQGDPNTLNLLKKYHVSYVVIGPSEIKDWNANDTFYHRNFPLVLNQFEYKVYDTRASLN